MFNNIALCHFHIIAIIRSYCCDAICPASHLAHELHGKAYLLLIDTNSDLKNYIQGINITVLSVCGSR